MGSNFLSMKIFRYKLPLSQPAGNPEGAGGHREGLLFTCDYMAFSVYGETAPLPGFSIETIDQIEQYILEKHEIIDRYFMQDNGYETWNAFAASLSLPPSLRFGLDTFLFDRLSKHQKLPLCRYLNKLSPPSIKINALIREAEPEKMLLEAREYWNRGFRTLKVKGNDDFERTKYILNRLKDEFPDAHLRLDANQAWTVDEAVNNLLALEPLNLEYCEQPIKVVDMLMRNELCMRSSIPIAADEAARSVEAIEKLIENNAADLLVIKPMLIGSFDELFRIAEIARNHGIELVFTSSLEAGIGRVATAHLAAALGSTRFAHGLATGGILARDFIDDTQYIRDGYFYLRENPGLDINPDFDFDEQALKQL